MFIGQQILLNVRQYMIDHPELSWDECEDEILCNYEEDDIEDYMITVSKVINTIW